MFELKPAETFRRRRMQKDGATGMTEGLTAYDPAGDLGSGEGIAVFMAEAFRTNDAAYISNALGVVARAKGMARSPARPGCRESSSTVLSVRGETPR
jgi:probable addiction module antidote protein